MARARGRDPDRVRPGRPGATGVADLGRSEDAEPVFRRALAITDKNLGPSHPDVLAARQNLAALQQVSGDPSSNNALATERARLATELDGGLALELRRAVAAVAEALERELVSVLDISRGPFADVIELGCGTHVAIPVLVDLRLQLLERRLDNVIFRLGVAPSRSAARQLVNHGHFEVNGKKVDIPSYQVRVGDVVSIKERSKETFAVQHAIDTIDRSSPEWLDVNTDKRAATVTLIPSREQIDTEIKEQLIVELYSK